ncbi:MAG: RicAFT regulatory complex protein RicA family protein [Bacillaceae bacterium]|nr:RicAFT regulatory complex protein RicA family protein [Bacillaceae bacterium]
MKQEQNIVDQKEILDKARELAELIANSSEVDFFKRAEQQIKQNASVQNLINQIKKKQKEAVSLEHMNKHDLVKKVEAEIDALQDQLDEIPIVREFKQSQVEVNDLLQMVTHVITNTVTDHIIVSTGGDPLYGETGGPKAGDDSCGCGC